MTRPRSTIAGTIREAITKLVVESQRYDGAGDQAACTCAHPRSDHCGCGQSCLQEACSCRGYLKAPETP